MFVRVETVPGPGLVRVHTSVGSAVVTWCGDPGQADGPHHVEWTLDVDLVWGRNTRPAAHAGAALRDEGHRVVLCGRLDLAEDNAVLSFGDAKILLDVDDRVAPFPASADGTRVEIDADRADVTLWPYLT